MKYVYLAILALLFLINLSASANPFQCRLSDEKVEKTEIQENVVYKGFTSIGNRRFGLIQIGKKDFQVTEGIKVNGIVIKRISAKRLDYVEKNKRQYILLEIK